MNKNSVSKLIPGALNSPNIDAKNVGPHELNAEPPELCTFHNSPDNYQFCILTTCNCTLRQCPFKNNNITLVNYQISNRKLTYRWFSCPTHICIILHCYMVLYSFILVHLNLLNNMLHTNVWLKFPFVCPIYPIYMRPSTGNIKSHWTARTPIEPPTQNAVEPLSTTAPIVHGDA